MTETLTEGITKVGSPLPQGGLAQSWVPACWRACMHQKKAKTQNASRKVRGVHEVVPRRAQARRRSLCSCVSVLGYLGDTQSPWGRHFTPCGRAPGARVCIHTVDHTQRHKKDTLAASSWLCGGARSRTTHGREGGPTSCVRIDPTVVLRAPLHPQ